VPPKGNAFGTRVGELDALRSDRDNPHAVRLFADMDDDEIRQAIEVVTRIADEAIWQVITAHGGSPAVADKMITRKADMAGRLAEYRDQAADSRRGLPRSLGQQSVVSSGSASEPVDVRLGIGCRPTLQDRERLPWSTSARNDRSASTCQIEPGQPTSGGPLSGPLAAYKGQRVSLL
jgi:hypothetical protein